ncbi:MAG: RNA-directed DNA polymerase [Rickettsiales bacterium]|jgi:hypothetical protein|nr:RNA-directed DNA polymerase [Rickettsiales bacterium]
MTDWERFISAENFALALRKAAQGRRANPGVMRFMENAAENLERIRADVAAGRFATSPYRTMEVRDPKRRTIYILPFNPDRIVHHAVMNIVAPVWERIFIRDSYACIKGRGQHLASRRAMEFARKNKYVLKCDIRKFYPSIRHDAMSEVAGRFVKDPGILKILRGVIYSIPGGRNMPIGNLCSQWMGNLYLHDMDVFIKRRLGCKCYLRYCDDFCLFSDDKRQLKEWRGEIGDFIRDRLDLEFSKSEIFPVKSGLDFVGYRHFPSFVMIRKRTAKKMCGNLRRIGAMKEIPAHKMENLRGQVAAAYGWMKHACTYNLQKKLRMGRLKRMTGIKG